MDRTEALDETKRLITKSRNLDYGDAIEEMHVLAQLWSAYLSDILKQPIKPYQTFDMMCLLKLERNRQKPKLDNSLDLMGYGALVAEIVTKEQDDKQGLANLATIANQQAERQKRKCQAY